MRATIFRSLLIVAIHSLLASPIPETNKELPCAARRKGQDAGAVENTSCQYEFEIFHPFFLPDVLAAALASLHTLCVPGLSPCQLSWGGFG